METITVTEEQFNAFVELLDRPAQAMPKLEALMKRKAPWDNAE